MYIVMLMRPKGPDVDQPKMSRRARRRAAKTQANRPGNIHVFATSTPPAIPATEGDAPMSGWMRLLTGLVALVVLGIAAVIAVVVIGTQVAFYRAQMKVQEVSFEKLGINQALDLPTFTPLATEGVVWACTLMAVVLVLLNRTSALWTRAMWVFSGIQAFVNTWHAVRADDDFLGGVVKGGLSIAGPIVVHLFILWVRHVRTGKTLARARLDVEIRWQVVGRVLLALTLALLDHVAHPLTAIRAIGIWRGFRGASYSAAWHIASTPWRVKVSAKYSAAASAGKPKISAGAPAEASAEKAADERHTKGSRSRAGSADNGTDQRPASAEVATTDALIGALISGPGADFTPFADDIERWLQGQGWDAAAEADQRWTPALTDGRSPSSTSETGTQSAPPAEADQRTEASDVSEPAEASKPRRSAGKGVRRLRRSARADKPDFTKLVTDYYNQRISAGAKPEDITGPEAAEATGASPQHARNVLAQLKRKGRK